MKLKLPLIALLSLVLSSCVTSFYADGHKVASFSGDMRHSEFTRYKDGTIVWLVDAVDHSSATKAAGKAITNTVVASGTVVTAVSAQKYFK